MDMIAPTAIFLYCVCPALFTLTPSSLLLTSVPSLVLRTPLLPWTVWMPHMPLSACATTPLALALAKFRASRCH
jgi:hypothetical protein